MFNHAFSPQSCSASQRWLTDPRSRSLAAPYCNTRSHPHEGNTTTLFATLTDIEGERESDYILSRVSPGGYPLRLSLLDWAWVAHIRAAWQVESAAPTWRKVCIVLYYYY